MANFVLKLINVLWQKYCCTVIHPRVYRLKYCTIIFLSYTTFITLNAVSESGLTAMTCQAMCTSLFQWLSVHQYVCWNNWEFKCVCTNKYKKEALTWKTCPCNVCTRALFHRLAFFHEHNTKLKVQDQMIVLSLC